MIQELSTICDFIRYATSQFNRAELSFTQGFDNALDEATFLVLRTLHLPHDMPPAYASATLTASERAEVLARIERRVAREPIAYITGEAWFCGLPFSVSPAVLVPRSPIGELIEQAFQPWLEHPPHRILDMCTGSGCIAIAMARQFPASHVDAVDISPAAISVAHSNIVRHGVADRVELLESDLFDALARRKYDLIVANPPYVSESEMRTLAPEFAFEPSLALVSGADGLSAPIAILYEACEHLTADGLLILEVGGSEGDLMAQFPELPGVWVEFTRGGSGVLAVHANELASFRPQLARALTERVAES
jgi:ribosomal protein L3 glutamine methyltransferase